MTAVRSSAPTPSRSIPTYDRLIWPVVLALRSLGGSASLAAIEEEIVHREGFSEEQQAVVHGNGPKSEIFYRMQWALTYLKAVGASDSNGRGTHWLTEYGQRLSEGEAVEIPSRVRAARPRKQRAATEIEPERDGATAQIDVPAEQTLS